MTLKLNHLHLKTKDPVETVKFYVETLGAKVVSQSPNGSYRIDQPNDTLRFVMDSPVSIETQADTVLTVEASSAKASQWSALAATRA